MATIKVTKSVNVEDIYVHVNCPNKKCKGNRVSMRLRGSETRKNCPLCNGVTYIFSITPLRGFIQIEAVTIGEDQTPRDYDLLATDVEFDGREDQEQ